MTRVPWWELQLYCNGCEVRDGARRLRLFALFYNDQQLPVGCELRLPPSPWVIDWQGFIRD